MITVIVKKENEQNCTSYKASKNFKRKGIRYLLYVLKWKIKGFEVNTIKEKIKVRNKK